MKYIEIKYHLLSAIDDASTLKPRTKLTEGFIKLYPDDNRVKLFEKASKGALLDIFNELEKREVLRVDQTPLTHEKSIVTGRLMGRNYYDLRCYLFKKLKKFKSYFKYVERKYLKMKKEQEEKEKEISSKEPSSEIFRITFDPKIREVVINDYFVLAKPNFNTENFNFFDYVYKHQNKIIYKNNIESALKSKLTKDFNDILQNLRFVKSLRKLFFPGVSRTEVYFRNPITKEDFESTGIGKIRIKVY